MAVVPENATPEAQPAPAPTPQPLPTSAASWMAGANNGAVVPAVTPQDETAPELVPGVGAPARPGSFSAKLSEELSKIAKSPAAPAVMAQPGGWARAMIGATLGAMSNASTRLGDVAAATEQGGTGGFFGGAARTAAAENARVSAEKQQQFKNDIEQKKLSLEEQQTKQAILTSNAQMIHSQALTHQVGEAAINESIASGKQAVATLQSSPSPAPILGEGLTSSEVEGMISAGTFKPSEGTAYPTGRRQVGENEDGTPKYRTTYTLTGLPKEVKVTDPAEAAELVKYFPGQQIDVSKVSPQNPWSLPGVVYNQLQQQADTNRAATLARNKALVDAKILDADQARKLEAVTFAGANVWTNALSSAMRSGASATDAPIVALQALQQNPDIAKKYPNLRNDVIQSFGEKQWDALEQKYAENVEKIRHDKAEEANKAQELAQKKQQEVVSNLTGDDYLKTLPSAQQGMVRAVAEGRQLLPANRKEALALLEQVHQAYPDYDESKGKTWQKVSNEYRGSGQTAKKVVSYNTALEHMQDLYNNTTAEGIFNPVSKAHQDREVAMGYVANEVGNAIKNGVMSKEEGQKILSDLSGGITPANKRERIAETARLLHDKIEEYQNKFAEGAPSLAVKVPLLISPRAAASFDFVQSGGQQQPQQRPVTPQMPKGATMKVPGSDGKLHWSDGKADLGVAQ